MAIESRLKLNIENVKSSIIGSDHGITDREFRNLSTSAKEVLNRCRTSFQNGEIGFMKIPQNTEAINQIDRFTKEHRNRWQNLVMIGIGGSSLGMTMLIDALCHPYHNFLDRELRNFTPRLFIVDNIDPEALSGLKTIINPEQTLVCIVTKSGSTVETWGNFFQYLSVFNYQPKPEQIVAITDQDEGFLSRFARIQNWQILPIPRDVGGRFSVLTPVGLFAASMMSIDITRILEGAKEMHEICLNNAFAQNPALQLAAVTWFLMTRKKKTISVMMPYSNALRSFSHWYGQLWAESLGKQKNLDGHLVCAGQTPVQALGATDQHSQIQLYREGPNDKLITFIEVESFRFGGPMNKAPEGTPLEHLRFLDTAEVLNIELAGTREILTQNQRPNISVTIPAVTPFYLGQLIYLYEMTTLFTANLLRINPLDQPGIEAGKQYVKDSIEKVYRSRTGEL